MKIVHSRLHLIRFEAKKPDTFFQMEAAFKRDNRKIHKSSTHDYTIEVWLYMKEVPSVARRYSVKYGVLE